MSEAHADREHMRREVSALLYELHNQGLDTATDSILAEQLLTDCNYMGLRDLENSLIARLEEACAWGMRLLD